MIARGKARLTNSMMMMVYESAMGGEWRSTNLPTLAVFWFADV